MAAAIPYDRHVVIDGAAHGGPLTHGAEIVEHLVEFLATARPEEPPIRSAGR